MAYNNNYNSNGSYSNDGSPWAASGGASTSTGAGGDYAGFRSEGREPGARRKKLAGYLKAANEIRQSYFSQDGAGARDGFSEGEAVEGPGSFPDAAVVRSGNEEMILFPSYARKHIKNQPKSTIPATPGSEISEQEYWQRQWEKHQNDNAVVDVDVRGWIYTPHRGHANRKQRLMIGLARQLSGVPAPPASKGGESSSASSSRAPSPTRQEEDLIALEAENIVRKGEQESRFANRGAFSEGPGLGGETNSLYDGDNNTHRLSQVSLASSTENESLTPPKKRQSWQQPTKMSSAELHTANKHLLNRLRPFMATPLANTPISAFFYNASASRQHTVYTNAAGHFTCRAPLDFVPTHVRVLAGEKLSATEEVTITSPTGVSLISDIDDTIKHSAVSAGAREIFRTAFIRELGDLTIEGVREWYNKLSDMGVKMHYVSNSPWQMYPVLTTYFKLAHLPKGSFHLKQYTGMLQGIFEPVAERKRSNLDRIFRDFPDRRFILVGDSGEADLEVYTEVALENPGRVLGIFIRDVTTAPTTGYFDSNGGNPSGGRRDRNHSRHRSGDGDLFAAKRFDRPRDTKEDDADLRAAIAASLADMEQETSRARKNINPDALPSEDRQSSRDRPELPPRRRQNQTISDPPRMTASPEELLIDFSDEPPPDKSFLSAPPREGSPRQNPDMALLGKKPSPSPPPKPSQFRSPSPNSQSQKEKTADAQNASKSPPPRPRKPSTAVKPSQQQVQAWTSDPALNKSPAIPPEHQPSPLRQVTQQSPSDSKKDRPALPARPKSRGFFSAREKAQLPGSSSMTVPDPTTSRPETARAYSVLSSDPNQAKPTLRPLTAIRTDSTQAPAPPPRRRNAPVLPPGSLTSRKSLNRLSAGWMDDGSGGSLPGSPSEAGVTRKEFMWMQRWARAKRVLEPQGVTLRTWRVGGDVAGVCERLVEMEFREMERRGKS